MNIAWHIAQKDLRRFWVPLCLQVLLILTQFALGLLLLHQDPQARTKILYLALYAKLAWVGGLTLIYISSGAVILEDPLVGANAAWKSRPITGGQLLAGKALGLAIMFGLLPILVHVPWWLGFHLTATDIAAQCLEMLAIHGGIILVAAGLAVVTGGLGHFLLWIFVAPAAALAASTIILAGVSNLDLGDNAALASRVYILIFAVPALLLAIIVFQYLYRRQAWTVISLVTLFCGSFIFLGYLPWHGRSLWAPASRRPSGLAKEMSLQFISATESSLTGGKMRLTSQLGVDGVPDGLAINKTYSVHQLSWSDGYKIVQGGWEWRSAQPSMTALNLKPDPATTAQQLKRDEYRARRWLVPPMPKNNSVNERPVETLYTDITLPVASLIAIKESPPAYEIDVWMSLYKTVVETEFSLSSGNLTRNGARRVEVRRVHQTDEAVPEISIVRAVPRLAVWEGSLAQQLRGPSYDTFWYLKHGEGLGAFRGYTTHTFETLVVGGVAFDWMIINFGGQPMWDKANLKWRYPTSFQKDDNIVELGFENLERFSMAVHIPELHVSPPFSQAYRRLEGFVLVNGEVEKPGTKFDRWPLLRSALSDAGGLTEAADASAIKITRTVPGRDSPEMIIVNLEDYLTGKAPPLDRFPLLQAGDIVEVPRKQ